MKRPHRNIEIFSMSVLDMFASALGAFLICSVILFPFYKRGLNERLAATSAELSKLRTEITEKHERATEIERQIGQQREMLEKERQAVAEGNQCRQGLNRCQAELAKTFLVVQIEWKEQVPVDLHVTDPHGNEFYWAMTNRSGHDFRDGTRAWLSFTSNGGPNGGVQAWLDPEAIPGQYKIEYVTTKDPSQDAVVSGWVYDRYGSKTLAEQTFHKGSLRGAEIRIAAATIEIAADGAVSVR
jgi:hypothetical protein